jgi:sec-independent protein translocase protein TatA
MNTSFALLNLGGGEIILIVALILILFGSKTLPNMAKGLGAGIEDFRKENVRQQESIEWSRNEIFLIVTLICLTVIEVLALGAWLLQ